MFKFWSGFGKFFSKAVLISEARMQPFTGLKKSEWHPEESHQIRRTLAEGCHGSSSPRFSSHLAFPLLFIIVNTLQ